MALQHGPQRFEHHKNGLVEFRFGWVFGFNKVENLINVIRRRIALGRFHDMTHRLASEFILVLQTDCQTTKDAAELRLVNIRGRDQKLCGDCHHLAR
jgi:hypothetical protein